MDVKNVISNPTKTQQTLLMTKSHQSQLNNLVTNNESALTGCNDNQMDNENNSLLNDQTNNSDNVNDNLTCNSDDNSSFVNLNSLNCGDAFSHFPMHHNYNYNQPNMQKLNDSTNNDIKLDEEGFSSFTNKLQMNSENINGLNDASKMYQYLSMKTSESNDIYIPNPTTNSTNYDLTNSVYRNVVRNCQLNPSQQSQLSQSQSQTQSQPSQFTSPSSSCNDFNGVNSSSINIMSPMNQTNNYSTINPHNICPTTGYEAIQMHNNPNFSCSCPYCISFCQQQWYMNYYGSLSHFAPPNPHNGGPPPPPPPPPNSHNFQPHYMLSQSSNPMSPHPTSMNHQQSPQQQLSDTNNQLMAKSYDPTFRPIMLMKSPDMFYPNLMPDSQEVDQKLAHLTPIYINQPVPSNTEHFQRRTPFKKRDHNALSWLLLYLELEKDVESPTMNARIAWINDMHHVIYTKLTSGIISRWQYEYDFSQLKHLITQKSMEADEMFKIFPKLCHCGERFKNEIELTDHLIHCVELKTPWHRCLCGQLFDQHIEFFQHIFSGILHCPMAVYHLWIFFEKYRRRRYKCFCSVVFHNFWVYYVHMGECVEYQNYFQRNCYFCQENSKKSIDNGSFWCYPMVGPLTDLVRQSKIQ